MEGPVTGRIVVSRRRMRLDVLANLERETATYAHVTSARVIRRRRVERMLAEALDVALLVDAPEAGRLWEAWLAAGARYDATWRDRRMTVRRNAREEGDAPMDIEPINLSPARLEGQPSQPFTLTRIIGAVPLAPGKVHS